MGPGRGGGRRVGSGRIVTYRGLADYPETLHTGGMQKTVFFRFHQADDHRHVVVFEGEHVGDGCDGEPLTVPTRVVETLTWTQFAAKHLQQEGVA